MHWTSALGALTAAVGSFWQAGQALKAYSDVLKKIGVNEYASLYAKLFGYIGGSSTKKLLIPLYPLINLILHLPNIIITYIEIVQIPSKISARVEEVKADAADSARLVELARLGAGWVIILVGVLSILASSVIQLVLDYK